MIRRFFHSHSCRLPFLRRQILHHQPLKFVHSSSQEIDLINHKDWLSPKEVIKIFNQNPKSTLQILTQLANRKDYAPNEAIYAAVINNLARVKDFDGIDTVIERLKIEKKCKISDDFFRNVIRVYGLKAGRINRAIEVLFDMPSFECWPSVKTFNFVLNLLVNSRQFDVVPEVFVGADKLGVKIDACCLNILIKGLCKNGQFDAAYQVFDEFPKQGCVPSVRTYNTLMHGLCEHGRVDEAFALLGKMESEGIEPETITINVLMAGFRKCGRVEESMKLFNVMMLKGCEPSSSTYQEALFCLIDSKRFVEAKDFMTKMVSKRMVPGFESYKLVIQGLCSEKLVSDVEFLLKQMVENGYMPKRGMWTHIVECMLSENENEARHFLQEFLSYESDC